MSMVKDGSVKKMSMMKMMNQMESYQPPDPSSWTGRKSNEKLGAQYWHQAVDLFDFNSKQVWKLLDRPPDFALLGYACDEGVRRNSGRPGAKNGPQSLRDRLGRLAYHHPLKMIADCGNITCEHSDLERSQKGLARMVSQLIEYSIFPILYGGGHDIAYGHFSGIIQAINRSSTKKIGIVNFDAHFDLRPVVNGSNSGTPFYQILHEYPDNVSYFVVGIQKPANPIELFDIATRLNVNYILHDACIPVNQKDVIAQLQSFANTVDFLYITIDLDGFASAFAPGVSAPSPVGFTPDFIFPVLANLLTSGKVISSDIAELNPAFDIDQSTANLAARLVDFIVGCKV